MFYKFYDFLNRKDVRERILRDRHHERNLWIEEKRFIGIEHEKEKIKYMRKIKYLIIHCSDSTFGNVHIVRKWHTDPPRNWRDVGYHYIICNGNYQNNNYDVLHDGIIEPGRKIDSDPYIDSEEQGAHARFFNKESIGACMIGKDKFTPRQFEAATCLIKYWQKLIPDIKIIGHCEINSGKTCPNIDMDIFRSYLGAVSNMPDIQIFFRKYLA